MNEIERGQLYNTTDDVVVRYKHGLKGSMILHATSDIDEACTHLRLPSCSRGEAQKGDGGLGLTSIETVLGVWGIVVMFCDDFIIRFE